MRLRKSDTDNRRNGGNLSYDHRLPIESDYGRLVFSSSFRRLHDKTQLFPLTTNDNIHSRLTHSNEVASVGRSFALNIMQSEKVRKILELESDDITLWRSISTLVEVVCLAHDIGNPPFGHFGENVISCYFSNLFNSVELELKSCAGDMEKLSDSKNIIIRSEIQRAIMNEVPFKDGMDDSFAKFFRGEDPSYNDYVLY